ncbi:ferredoxin--NADP reductase [Saccharopolyspora gloriosae]|uniref:3-ketosteroid 9alpha-monooxygenase subunit B n=1 Tax=Saccharopolyspora gloriosae TaxID=455344 RepID=A0A840NGE3_9PSEU|nr:ferredoxin--NADP reductase [Saccharopolyspora gloriosae]MBB5069328.1 3-ketosteroid 9alpha-monooxygenase subunit B [Saccharopolyspora gloriosae]
MSEPSESGVHRLKVDEVVEETPDAISLVFAVPDGGEFAYRPGQFLTLRVPGEHGGSVARCYSLSSSPHTDSAPRVTVKRVPGGHGSNWLCDNATAGSIVDVLAPDGGFTPKSLDGNFLMLAGGSGITPIMSIVRSVLAGGDGRIVLLYANRDEQSVIFAAALRELAARHPGRLTVVHWLETVQGLPDESSLRALAEPFADHEAFVCGPGAFMDVACGALEPLGFARDRLHVERFLSLAENPFERGGEPEPAEPAQPDATVEVDIDGARHRFDWPRRQRLLDLLLERGIDAPYSCRQGACSACACRISGGEVSMVRNDILEQEDLDDGIVLACQSLPVTDEVHVSYE